MIIYLLIILMDGVVCGVLLFSSSFFIISEFEVEAGAEEAEEEVQSLRSLCNTKSNNFIFILFKKNSFFISFNVNTSNA